MDNRILHIASADKFIQPFIAFLERNADMDRHEFRLFHGAAGAEIAPRRNVYLADTGNLSRLTMYLSLPFRMHLADKIVLHGLFDPRIVMMLFFMPWLAKKCYWVIRGWDLYVHSMGERDWKWTVNEFFRGPVLKRIQHLVTYVKGDYELARRWYGSTGQYHECLMYPSNVFEESGIEKVRGNNINILVGNSADPSNNHMEILDRLGPFKDQEIEIFVPLSYGDPDYARVVLEEGKRRFGDKFTGLLEFMPHEKYVSLLAKMDVAIFNHERQQAMGNLITLLGLGKRVYLRRDVPQWELFKSNDIEVLDVNDFVITKEKFEHSARNKVNVRQFFSAERHRQQLVDLFD